LALAKNSIKIWLKPNYHVFIYIGLKPIAIEFLKHLKTNSEN